MGLIPDLSVRVVRCSRDLLDLHLSALDTEGQKKDVQKDKSYKASAIGGSVMESKLAGMIIIVLVISAAAVFTIASMRKEKTTVVMLQNDYPPKLIDIEKEGKQMTFSHGFLARRDLVEVEIRFSFLHSSPEPALFNNQTEPSFRNYLQVAYLEKYLGGYEWLCADEFETDLEGDKKGNRAHFYDVGRTLHLFSSPSSAGSLASVFGTVAAENGNLTYYRGFSDFFFERKDTIRYLVVSHRGNETSYSSSRSGQGNIADAPKGGTVILHYLKKGDMVVVEFSVEPDRDHLPERAWDPNYNQEILEVIRVYADGELVLTKVNVIEVDLL